MSSIPSIQPHINTNTLSGDGSNKEDLKMSGEYFVTCLKTSSQSIPVFYANKNGRATALSTSNAVSSSTLHSSQPLPIEFSPLCGQSDSVWVDTCRLKFQRLYQTSTLILSLCSIIRRPISNGKTVLQMGKGLQGLQAAHSSLLPGAVIRVTPQEIHQVVISGLKREFDKLSAHAQDIASGDKEDIKFYTILFYPNLFDLFKFLSLPVNDDVKILQKELEDFRSKLDLDPKAGIKELKIKAEKQTDFYLKIASYTNAVLGYLDSIQTDHFPAFENDNLLEALHFRLTLNATDDLPCWMNKLDGAIEGMMRQQLWTLANECASNQCKLEDAIKRFDWDLRQVFESTYQSVCAYETFFQRAEGNRLIIEEELINLHKQMLVLKARFNSNQVNITLEERSQLQSSLIILCMRMARILQERKKLKTIVTFDFDSQEIACLTNEASTNKLWAEGGIQHSALPSVNPKIPYFEENIDCYLNGTIQKVFNEISSFSTKLLLLNEIQPDDLESMEDFLMNLPINLVTKSHEKKIAKRFPGLIPGKNENKEKFMPRFYQVLESHITRIEPLLGKHYYLNNVYPNRTRAKQIDLALKKKNGSFLLLRLTERLLLNEKPMRNGSAMIQETLVKYIQERSSEQFGLISLIDGSLGKVFNANSEIFSDGFQPVQVADTSWMPKSANTNEIPFPGETTPLHSLIKQLNSKAINAKKDRSASEALIGDAINLFEHEIDKRKKKSNDFMQTVLQSSASGRAKEIAAVFIQKDCLFQGRVDAEQLSELTEELKNSPELSAVKEYLSVHGQELLFLTVLKKRLEYSQHVQAFLMKMLDDPEVPPNLKRRAEIVINLYQFHNIVIGTQYLDKFSNLLFPSTGHLKLVGAKSHPGKINEELVHCYRNTLKFMREFREDRIMLNYLVITNEQNWNRFVNRCAFSELEGVYDSVSFAQCGELANSMQKIALSTYLDEFQVCQPQSMRITLLAESASVSGFKHQNWHSLRRDRLVYGHGSSEELAFWATLGILGNKENPIVVADQSDKENVWERNGRNRENEQQIVIDIRSPEKADEPIPDRIPGNLSHRLRRALFHTINAAGDQVKNHRMTLVVRSLSPVTEKPPNNKKNGNDH